MKLSIALSATATFLLMGRTRSLPAEYDDGMVCLHETYNPDNRY